MSQFRINGIQTGGSLHSVTPASALENAKKAAKSDGLDQVFLKVEDQTLVLQGDGLNLKSLNDGSADKSFSLEIDGETFEAEVLHVDNETNTFMEGIDNDWSRAGAAATAAGATVTVATGLFGGAAIGGTFTAAAGAFTGLTGLAGGLYGAFRGVSNKLERHYLGNALNAQDLRALNTK